MSSDGGLVTQHAGRMPIVCATSLLIPRPPASPQLADRGMASDHTSDTTKVRIKMGAPHGLQTQSFRNSAVPECRLMRDSRGDV